LERDEESRRLFHQANGSNAWDDDKSRRSDALDRQQPACEARFVAALGPIRIVVRMVTLAVGTVLMAVFAAVFRGRSNLARSAATRAVMGMAGVVVQRLNGSRRE
jgi:hypothetical protein